MSRLNVIIFCLLLSCLSWSQGVRELFTEEELKTLSPQEVQKLYRVRLEEKRKSSRVKPTMRRELAGENRKKVTNSSMSRGVTNVDKTKLLRGEKVPASGDMMTIDFVDTDIREVARTISMAYGYSIIIDNDVSARISIHLEDVDVVEGLSAICRSNNLELTKEGDIYRISNATEETIELLKMKRKKMDLDVQNQEIKKFIKSFTDKTGLNILAGKDIEGTITGSWKNQLPLDGFKALMTAHEYKVRKRNGFYIVTGVDEAGKIRGGPRRMGTALQGSRVDIDVSGDSVSVSLENANLSDVLKIIAQESGINTVFFGDIRETINASLHKLPLAEAISMLLKGSKYTYLITEEGTLLVGSKDPKTPAGKILTSYEMYPLKHLKSENITKVLPKSISQSNITIIKEHNAILIMGTTSEIESVKKYLDIVDIAIPQVLLECVIVEYKRGNGEEFGFKASNRSASDSLPGLNAFVDFGANGGNVVKKRNLGDATLGIGFLNSEFFYNLVAQERDNKAKVLAMPKITTLNGNKANIKVTNTSYRLIEKAGTATLGATTDYKAFNDGITLAITPFVTNGGQITLDIQPEIKTATQGEGASAPDISTRSLSTTVSLLNNQTIMLGGLIQTQKTVVNEYVPFLGAIPFIGAFFSYKDEKEATTELVIYITPYIQNPENFGIDLKSNLLEMESRDGEVKFEENIDIYRYQTSATLEIDTVQLKAIQDSLNSISETPLETGVPINE